MTSLTTPTVTLCATGARLPCPKGENCLLEVLEQHDIAVEFQCRSGYCGACRMKLLKGEVTYQQPPLAFISAGEILPCCCMPLVDIEVEV